MSRRRTGPPVFFGKEQQMENLETTAGGLPALQDASAEELAQAIYDVLDAKKAHDVKLLPVGDKTVLAEYFVICTETPARRSRRWRESWSVSSENVA